MNRLVRRYIILFLCILIPLIAAYLVGAYGYNSPNFGQKAWKDEFSVEYLTFEDEYTTRNKIERYMEYGINNQYYSFNTTPVYEKEVKNESGDKLFDLLVIRAVYDLDAKGTDRFQYLFFIYNVQYKKLRDLFDGDESRRNEINNAKVPTFVASMTSLPEDESEEGVKRGITQIPEEALSFPDYNADVKYKSGKSENDEIAVGDSFVKVYMGFVPMREVNVDKNYNVSIDIMIASIVDDTGTSIKTQAYNFDIELEPNPANVDYSKYQKSHMQNLDNAGYFSWAFRNYLWWICLITFAAVGLVTGSFFIVYLSEEKRIVDINNKNKKKRK